MNINPLIQNALSDVGCPISPVKHDGNEDAYIVYYTLIENGELFADDEQIAEGTHGTVNIFSKSDYKSLAKDVKNKLKQAGFTIKSSGQEIFEKDYFSYIIEIYMEGEDD